MKDREVGILKSRVRRALTVVINRKLNQLRRVAEVIGDDASQSPGLLGDASEVEAVEPIS